MKHVVILGAGTAGTIMANHMRKRVDRTEWKITIVDKEGDHYYQPGFLFLPFDIYTEEDIVRPKRRFVGAGVINGFRAGAGGGHGFRGGV